MAGRGPTPKDPAQRRRTNADPIPTAIVDSDDELRGPPLPEDALPEPWHPRTLAWWDTWRRSPQATTFIATDWDFLLDTALMHHTMWSKGRWEFASELRLRAAKFGATPEDRARLRMQVTATPAPKPAASEGRAGGRYGHLRTVKSA
jgi:hypothetical protein